ncbi:MAG: oligosaccharide flippase family protein [Pseudohongiellaceae bacterium]
MTDQQGGALSRQLLRGATGMAGLNAIKILLTLLTGVVLARVLGPEDYGVYVFILSLVTVLGLPTSAGLPVLVLRETARNQLTGHWGKLHGLLRSANGFVCAVSILIALGVFALLSWTPLGDQSDGTATLLWGLWLLPLAAFGSIRGATLRGLRKVVAGQLPEQLIKPATQLLLLLFVMFAGASLTPELAMQLNVISALAAFGVGAWLLWVYLPGTVREAVPEYEFRPWLHSLLPFSMIAGMKVLDSQLIILLLGGLSTAENVGLYRVAAQGAALVTFGMTAVNMVMSPHVARLYQQGDLESLQRLVALATRTAFLIAFPVALLLIVFGRPLITLVFGAEYSEAALPLAILCCGQLFNVAVGSVGVILNMAGHERESLKAFAVAVLVSVVLAVILVPVLKSTGGAIAAACSLLVWNTMMSRSVLRHVGVKAFIVMNKGS